MSKLTTSSVQLWFSLVLLWLGACRTSAGGNQPGSLEQLATAALGDCTDRWEEFSAAPYTQFAFPDTSVRYWRYRFAAPTGLFPTLKITGRNPEARYFGFTVYDQKTLDSLGSLRDDRIAADPEQPGNFTVRVKPEGNTGPSGPNFISISTAANQDGERFYEIWYRVYVPSASSLTLPRIQAVSSDLSENPTPCPASKTTPPPLGAGITSLPPLFRDGSIHFYRPAYSGLYANDDNLYITARLNFERGELAHVKWRPPTRTGRSGEDVRFWSICLGGYSGRTSACLRDDEVKLDSHGLANLVVGPEDMAEEVARRGFNFVPRGRLLVPILVYRNLATRDEFQGDLKRIRTWSMLGQNLEADRVASAAEHFIADNAPTGQHYTRARFLKAFNPVASTLGTIASEPALAGMSGEPLDLNKLRTGLAWEYFFSTAISQSATENANQSGRGALLEVAEDVLKEFLTWGLDTDAKIETLAPDIIARKIMTGDLDLGIMPGVVYAWVKDHYPALEPLALVGAEPSGSAASDANPVPPNVTVAAAVIVHKTSSVEGLHGTLGQGLIIPSNTQFHALQYLFLALEKLNLDATAGFVRPRGRYAEAVSALDDVARQTEKLVSLVDETQLAFYKEIKGPTFTRNLRVLAESAPLPTSVVVYNPARWTEEQRASLAERLRLAQSKASTNNQVATTFGFSRIGPPTPTWRAALDAFNTGEKGRREYLLPAVFYDR